MKVKHDKNFYIHLIIQGTCAVFLMFAVLYSLDMVRAGNLIWAAGASTLASSAFIVFSKPEIDSAKPHSIILGYIIAIFFGHVVRLLADYVCLGLSVCHIPGYEIHIYEASAALSCGLTFLVMTMLRSNHPPAAGLAVVMVLDISSFLPMLVIGSFAVFLAIVRMVFRRQLKPLI